MKKIIISTITTVLAVFISSSFALSEANSTKSEKRKKYSRVNNFLNTKFPKSKAAPDYWK